MIQTSQPLSATFHFGYRPWLDGLRGIAIVLVFIHHLQHFIYKTVWSFFPFGSLGVDIFFVLSGFLITSLLLEEYSNTGTISLRSFYLRRALRLLPALFLLLTLTVSVAFLLLEYNEAIQTLRLSVIAVFYGTNWVFALTNLGSVLLGHLWSLAIEEQFYLLWPLALTLMLWARVPRPAAITGTAVLVGLVCLHRIILIDSGASLGRIYCATDTRIDTLLAGCVVAMLVNWKVLPGTRFANAVIKALGLVSVCAIVAYVINAGGIPGQSIYTFGLTIFAIACAGLILSVMTVRRSVFERCLAWSPLVWLGKISYSLYLWHFLSIYVTLLIPCSNIIRVIISIPITIGAASFSYYVVERPFLRLKQRYTPSLEQSHRDIPIVSGIGVEIVQP